MQAAPDPAGLWEGSLEAPGVALVVELNILRNGSEQWKGTISIPSDNVRGLPLARVTVAGASVTVHMTEDPDDRVFRGSLSTDGAQLSGTLLRGGETFPLRLERRGPPRADQPTSNPPLPDRLLGSWAGRMEADGRSMRISLVLTNQTDGTGAGTLANLDQGNVMVPLTEIRHSGARLTLVVPVVGGTFTAVIAEDGAELHGTWVQGTFSAPLRFTRGPVQ